MPSYIGPFPGHFFASESGFAKVCPETALMCAVLEDAFLCFQKQYESQNSYVQRAAEEAETWFFSDYPHELFSFVSVCAGLGLEPEYIRKKLRHWRQSRLDKSQGKISAARK
jgi:hypothetical protein